MTADFGGARAGITGDGRAEALARESLAAAEAKFGGRPPAETIRAAATRLREAAEKATPGKWTALCDGYGDTSGGMAHEDRRDLLWIRSGSTNAGDIVSTYGDWTERSEADVLYIALVNPVVGLAVADWLDAHAPYCVPDMADCDQEPCPALAVARALLGGSRD